MPAKKPLKFYVLEIGAVRIHIDKPNLFFRLFSALAGLNIKKVESLRPYGVFVDITNQWWYEQYYGRRLCKPRHHETRTLKSRI